MGVGSWEIQGEYIYIYIYIKYLVEILIITFLVEVGFKYLKLRCMLYVVCFVKVISITLSKEINKNK